MRVTVDDDVCGGHGVCVITCPEVFALTADGYSEVIVDEVPTGLEDRVRRAVDECPARAISVEDRS